MLLIGESPFEAISISAPMASMINDLALINFETEDIPIPCHHRLA